MKSMRKVFNFVDIIIIVVITAVLASFLGGFLIYNNKSDSQENDENLKMFYEAYDKLKDNYYEELSPDELINAAIEGMYKKTSDPYTSYLNDDDTNNLNNLLSGKYKGIGIVVEKAEEGFKIVSIIEDSPADKAKLNKDDIIIEIDLDSIKDLSLEEFTKKINEIESDSINLTIKRNEDILSFDVDIKTLYIPVSDYKLLDNNIGYISLNSFNEDAYKQFKSNLDELNNLNIKSLIIDLRNNTGGYLDSARRIAEIFLKKGKVIYYVERKNNLEKITDTTKERSKFNIAVLINGKSASATEVLAAALRDSYGATLVGEKSYGKGVIQEKDTLSNGNIVKYTTANWLTPKKKNIDTKGLEPDVYSKLDLDNIKRDDITTDSQVISAMNTLK